MPFLVDVFYMLRISNMKDCGTGLRHRVRVAQQGNQENAVFLHAKFPPQILRPEELVTEQIMVFEGEQSKTDKLQFIEAGASHDNSPDEGEEEEDLVQAGVVQIFVKRIMRSVCVAFQTNVFCAEHRILFCCNGSVYLYFALRICWNFQQELYIFLQGNATLYCGWPKLLHRFF